jgi:hypothetical protein
MQKSKIEFEIVYTPPVECFLCALNLSGNEDDIWDVGSSCIAEDTYLVPKNKFYIASHWSVIHYQHQKNMYISNFKIIGAELTEI